MLFDNKDLNSIDNQNEREAFQEVLQSYYSKNFRASIVSLFSLVMLDLYNKLQYMAEEGEEKAKKEIAAINKLIEDDQKYSLVEKEITGFFFSNYSLHFNKFSRDLIYLKETRDDCSHLKVNSSSLYSPSDYQVRMLICSMYDNLLSVKAPFLDVLFPFVKDDIEKYSLEGRSILYSKIEKAVFQKYEKKFFSRMTQTSLLKTMRSFIRLLFISSDDKAIENVNGLYVVFTCFLQYIDSIGLGSICVQDEAIQGLIDKIDYEVLKVSSSREDAFFRILCSSRWFCDECRKKEVFQLVVDKYLFRSNFFELYFASLFPEKVDLRWNFYLDNADKFHCDSQMSRYNYLKDSRGYSDEDFIKSEVNLVPSWTGFDDATSFMSFFLKNKRDFSDAAVEIVISAYNSNNQFYARRGGPEGIKELIQETNERGMTVDWDKYDVFSYYIQQEDENDDED